MQGVRHEHQGDRDLSGRELQRRESIAQANGNAGPSGAHIAGILSYTDREYHSPWPCAWGCDGLPGKKVSLGRVYPEIGIDISGNQTKSVFDFYKNGALFNYVVTVCDETSGESCPIFPGVSKKLHWGFADPSVLSGTYEEKLQNTRKIRDTIKEKIMEFVSEFKK